MCDLAKSDHMLCTNSAYLHYKDKKLNDGIFVAHMSNPRDMCLRDIDRENSLWITESSRKATCFPMLPTRGGNEGCEPDRPCPKIYTNYNLNEFLLIPCPKPTYRNYLVFNDKKMCSKSHQALNNWTKRRDITNEEEVYIGQGNRFPSSYSTS